MVRNSRSHKDRARILDEFIYLVYGTVVKKRDLEKGPNSIKTIDLSDGVILTELLDRAKLLT